RKPEVLTSPEAVPKELLRESPKTGPPLVPNQQLGRVDHGPSAQAESPDQPVLLATLERIEKRRLLENVPAYEEIAQDQAFLAARAGAAAGTERGRGVPGRERRGRREPGGALEDARPGGGEVGSSESDGLREAAK